MILRGPFFGHFYSVSAHFSEGYIMEYYSVSVCTDDIQLYILVQLQNHSNLL